MVWELISATHTLGYANPTQPLDAVQWRQLHFKLSRNVTYLLFYNHIMTLPIPVPLGLQVCNKSVTCDAYHQVAVDEKFENSCGHRPSC